MSRPPTERIASLIFSFQKRLMGVLRIAHSSRSSFVFIQRCIYRLQLVEETNQELLELNNNGRESWQTALTFEDFALNDS